MHRYEWQKLEMKTMERETRELTLGLACAPTEDHDPAHQSHLPILTKRRKGVGLAVRKYGSQDRRENCRV